MDDAKLVVVNSYSSRIEAELAKGALEAAGIPAMTQADTVGGMREHIAWSGAGFQVLVREEDAAAAREVLGPTVEDNSDEADGDSRSPWRRFT
jgi:putative signal transducing protein